MSAFVPRAVASTLAEPDPSKHVNYTLGMVLGVDDFKQEFAYLSGRDQWLARDLFGYGTVSGLQVNVEVENNAPQALVTPGVALGPRGHLVRVAPAQCADLDAWLTTHREELAKRVGDVKPNTAETRLYVTLCYRECSTDMIPIPGEPCRSADETVAASRVTDDFKLELRFEPPAQREEDALREYAEWLGQIEVKNESGESPRLQEFEEVIRKMASGRGEGRGASGLMSGPPPAELKIEAKHAARYLRTALNLWVTELRPRVQSWRPDIGSGPDAQAADKGEECLLLAELRVPLKRASSTAVWRVGDAKGVEVIEERRPVAAHVRMLQELLLNVGRAAKQSPPAYQTMAAGLVKATEGSGGNEFNNLRVTKVGAGLVSMTFDGYEQPDPATAPFQYIVKALLVLPADSTLTTPSVTFLRFEGAETGFTLGIKNAGKVVDKAALANMSLMVEVSRYATGGKDNKESKEKDAKEAKDSKESKEKDTKEAKEKDSKETKEKDTKESKEKDTKESKEKDTKESKEKDTKETKEKLDKEAEKVAKEKEAEKVAKEKDTKETKEKAKEKDTKESKEKDTKETKEKDTKETKEKDTKESKEKDTKESKEKDTKETKEKDTKETKEKDTKETKEKGKEKDTKESKEKDTKETKEKEAAKDTKEAKEEKANQDKLKDAAALKEIERSQLTPPSGPAFKGAAGDADATLASGRAFIRGDERPDVGRRALELADEPADEPADTPKPEDVGKPVDAGKPGEASGGKQAEAIN